LVLKPLFLGNTSWSYFLPPPEQDYIKYENDYIQKIITNDNETEINYLFSENFYHFLNKTRITSSNTPIFFQKERRSLTNDSIYT